MRRLVIVLALFLVSFPFFGQELNCEVVVNADRVTSGSDQVFKTLESSIKEFINDSKWTDKEYKNHERINSSMLITVTKQSGNNFEASIQVQSSRPVFNSIYTTPMINHKDMDFLFSYTEHEPLVFDKNRYQSELISVLSYYVYLILGVDADSFENKGGDEYFKVCRNIVDQVENPSSKKGWKSSTNDVNRYHLIDKLLASSNTAFRTAIYDYHINGLDKMVGKKKAAKQIINKAIISLKKISTNSMSSILFRFFINSKADEIVSIFSDGPQIETVELRSTLNKLSPINANKWATIK